MRAFDYRLRLQIRRQEDRRNALIRDHGVGAATVAATDVG
jgi:hypothetical protein